MFIRNQVAGFAPAQWRVSRVGPCPARVLAISTQEVQVEGIVIEIKCLSRVKRPAEGIARLLAFQEDIIGAGLRRRCL
jgi:hypothetical protein